MPPPPSEHSLPEELMNFSVRLWSTVHMFSLAKLSSEVCVHYSFTIASVFNTTYSLPV